MIQPNPRGRPLGIGKSANLWELTEAVKRLAIKREPRHYPTKPAGIVQGPSAKTRDKLVRYAELFDSRTPDGKPLTLQQISDVMGVTREMVRQVRKRYFPELAGIRAVRKSYVNQRMATKRFHNPTLFRRLVRGWLVSEGYFQCCHCNLVKCIETDLTKSGKGRRPDGSVRCKWCSADSTWQWCQTKVGKQKAKAWVKANPDKVREYQRRSDQKKRDRERKLNENYNHDMPDMQGN